jgi:hypothetical protein
MACVGAMVSRGGAGSTRRAPVWYSNCRPPAVTRIAITPAAISHTAWCASPIAVTAAAPATAIGQ